jgi:hypothetical protein
MCRSVGFTDSGELAAVVSTLGIAHPTGYPLFTVLGRCVIMIPSSVEEIIRLNIFASVLTAIAVSIFFKTTLVLRRSVAIFQPKRLKQRDTNDHRFILASAIASLVVGFSSTFWSQSTNLEVYALHLFLVLLTIWMFIDGLEEQAKNRNTISKKFILFAFILGLSFSNHMTTILLAPGFLWLFFRTFNVNKNSLIIVLKIAPFFLLGLSIYLYLPIRSSGYPMLDWGHPATLERFFWHVSGKQFRVWMFSGWSVVQKQLDYYFTDFLSEYSIAVCFCIIIGFIILLKQSRRVLVFLAFLFCTTIVYSVNYDIFDIGSYFLLSYIVIGWIVSFGIDFLLVWSENTRYWIRVVVLAVLLSLPLIQIVQNWKDVQEANKNLPEQFVTKSFSQLEPHAIVLASQWDYFISPSLYYQAVRKERCDLTLIDKSLLQNRTWYFTQLQHQAPWLMERIREQANLFLIELSKFEREEPFNFAVIQAYWQNLLAAIVEQSLPDHPVYIDARIEREFPSFYHRIPAGFFLRLSKTEDFSFYKSAVFSFQTLDTKQPVINDLHQYYISILTREADWLQKRGEIDETKNILGEILRIEPDNLSATWLMKKLRK